MRAPGSRARRSSARPSDAPLRRDSPVPQGLGETVHAEQSARLKFMQPDTDLSGTA